MRSDKTLSSSDQKNTQKRSGRRRAKAGEELFLLSINDAKGELIGAASSYLPYGLAGAILAELALLGRAPNC